MSFYIEYKKCIKIIFNLRLYFQETMIILVKNFYFLMLNHPGEIGFGQIAVLNCCKAHIVIKFSKLFDKATRNN